MARKKTISNIPKDVEFDIDYVPPVPPMTVEPCKEFIKIIDEYCPEYCQAIIEHSSKGFSVESFSGHEHIDPDVMQGWMSKYPQFKASVKIAISAEMGYWEKLSQTARDNLEAYKDMLPTINRKLAMLESQLCKNGLRKCLFNFTEPDPVDESKREDAQAIAEMDDFGFNS